MAVFFETESKMENEPLSVSTEVQPDDSAGTDISSGRSTDDAGLFFEVTGRPMSMGTGNAISEQNNTVAKDTSWGEK